MKRNILFTFIAITLCFMFTGVVKSDEVSTSNQFNVAIADPSVEVVKLTDNIEITSTNVDFIINGADRTLDLNGQTLTINGKFRPRYYTGNTQTIEDTNSNGKLVSNSLIEPLTEMFNTDPNNDVYLIINSGIFEINSNYVIADCNAFHLTFNGGTFKSTNYLFRFNGSNASDLTLNSLIFKNINESANNSIELTKDKYANDIVQTKLAKNTYLYYVDAQNNYSNKSNKTFQESYSADGYLKVSDEAYQLNFNSKGGSAVNPISVAFGDKAVKPNNPTKDGYEFGGWYEDYDAMTTPFDFSKVIIQSQGLYAKWLGDLGNMTFTKIPTTVSKVYNGKAQTQDITVTFDGNTLIEKTDYTVDYKDNINAGTAKAIIKGTGEYTGERTKTFQILQANNPMTVTIANKKVKYKKVKKKAQTVTAINTKNAKGTVTYTKVSGSKKFTVNKRTGKITIKKKTKKGTYKVGIKVKAAGNKNYNDSSKTVIVQIKIK